MIAEDVTDLPARTIARTIRNQHPDTVVLTFLGPADNGRVELVETHGSRSLLQPFNDAQQLIAGSTSSPRRGGPRRASGATPRRSASGTTTSCAATSSSRPRSSARSTTGRGSGRAARPSYRERSASTIAGLIAAPSPWPAPTISITAWRVRSSWSRLAISSS